MIECPDAVFAIALFNGLFLPLATSMSSEQALLIEWWLNRESRVQVRARLVHLRRFLLEAARLYSLPDRLLDAVLELLATYFQQVSSLSELIMLNDVTRSFFRTLHETASARLMDPRLLRAALWSGELDLMTRFVEAGIDLAKSADELLLLHYIMKQVMRFGDKVELFPLIEALYKKDLRHPLAIQHMAETMFALERSVDDVLALYDYIDSNLHMDVFRYSVEWIAQVCYAHGLQSKAAELFSRLSCLNDTTGHYVSWQQRVLQGRTAEPASVEAWQMSAQAHQT